MKMFVPVLYFLRLALVSFEGNKTFRDYTLFNFSSEYCRFNC